LLNVPDAISVYLSVIFIKKEKKGLTVNAIKQKLAATKANMDTMASAIPDSRQDIRQQLVASSGTKGGSSAGGTKRKSCGSLDVAGTCWYSMVIPNFNGFVIPKWS
jgi:hypothetical protein